MGPVIMEKGHLIIAGISGDGAQTGALWADFEKKSNETVIVNRADEHAYEARFDYDGKCDCHVGFAVLDEQAQGAFTTLVLPPSTYAVFDVTIEKGYDSENDAMERWLGDNPEKYIQSQLNGKHYIVECFNEKGQQGIVEMWIPVHKA